MRTIGVSRTEAAKALSCTSKATCASLSSGRTPIGRGWAFSLSNAGADYFEDRCDLRQLREINWTAIQAAKWSGSGVDPSLKEGKQAEFLVEEAFPWELVTRIGVRSADIRSQVTAALRLADHRPAVELQPDWYY